MVSTHSWILVMTRIGGCGLSNYIGDPGGGTCPCDLLLTQVTDQSFVVVQSLICVRLSMAPWTAAQQASMSFTISRSLFKPTSIESVIPSDQLKPLSPTSPFAFSLSQRQGLFQWVGSRIKWPEYWSFSQSFILLHKNTKCRLGPG